MFNVIYCVKIVAAMLPHVLLAVCLMHLYFVQKNCCVVSSASLLHNARDLSNYRM